MDLANEILGNRTLLLILISVAVTAVFMPIQEPMLLPLRRHGEHHRLRHRLYDHLPLGHRFRPAGPGPQQLHHHPGLLHHKHAHGGPRRDYQYRAGPHLYFRPRYGRRGAAWPPSSPRRSPWYGWSASLLGKKTKLKIQARFLRLRAKNPSACGRHRRVPLHHAVHREPGDDRPQLQPEDVRRELKDVYVGAMGIGSSIMQVLTMPFHGAGPGSPAHHRL